MEHQQFVVLVPVKAPSLGKSRLRVPDHLRPALATAFALDTLSAAGAARHVAEVVAVTSDRAFAELCRDRGVTTVPDGDGLNGSLVGAAASARGRHPDAVPVALCADLPCLLPDEVDAALAQVCGGSWLVADDAGTGTTMYAAAYDVFEPRFGTGSATAHRASGAHDVAGALPTLRHDVDDQASLLTAVDLGVGRHTREALAIFG